MAPILCFNFVVVEQSVLLAVPDQLEPWVKGCGICRIDLRFGDGELGEPMLPLIIGHQIVAAIVEIYGVPKLTAVLQVNGVSRFISLENGLFPG